MKKRVLAFLMMLVMLTSILPVPAGATDSENIVESAESIPETIEPETVESIPETTETEPPESVPETTESEIVLEVVQDETTTYAMDRPGPGGNTYDHIDVRVAGKLTMTTKVNGVVTDTETVSVNVTAVSATLNGSAVSGFYKKSGTGDENEWRCDHLSLNPASDTVTLTCTIVGTTEDGTEINLTVSKTYTGETTLNGFIQECPGKNGYDIDFEAEDLEEHFTVDITAAKVWEDNNDSAGKRPASVQIQLYADGAAKGDPVAVSDENGWTVRFEGLPKYSTGTTQIVYTVDEVEVPDGYEKTVNGYTITNKIAAVDVTATKVWADNDNANGNRPDAVPVQLYADGEAYGEAVELTADGNWSYTWTGLPKGKTYTIDETAVPAGYQKFISGMTLTNTETTTDITATKVWKDSDNMEGLRPDSVKLQLKADGAAVGEAVTVTGDSWSYTWTGLPTHRNGTAVIYTVEEVDVSEYYESSVDGYIITNSREVEYVTVSGSKTWEDAENQDGLRPESIKITLTGSNGYTDTKEVTPDENGDWTWSWTGLMKYAQGKEVTYTITEEPVDGYTSTVNGYDVTNTYIPETTEVEVTKVWNDNDNQDGKRPASVTVVLMADGEKVDTIEIKAAEDGTWTGKFENLPVYSSGKEIVYTVAEVLPEDSDYTASVDGFTITNTDAPDKTSVTVTKAWDDNNDQDGIRPKSVTLALMANKVKVQDIVLTAEDGWTATVSDLDKYYDNGKAIEYTFTEETKVEGYKYASATTDPETGIITITNVHKPEVMDLSVNKEWDDKDNQDGLRPESVKITLYANGEKVETVELSKSTKWKYKWEDMAVYANGKKITYTVRENEVPAGYTTEDYYELKGGKATVVNTHVPEIWSTDITKVWFDNNDAADRRPDSVTVRLYKNGKRYGNSFKITAKDGWKVAVDLPVYEDGEKITWTVKETRVPSYYSVSYKQETLTIRNTIQIDGVPQTGDDFNLKLWVSVMGVSAAAVLALLIIKKKKR